MDLYEDLAKDISKEDDSITILSIEELLIDNGIDMGGVENEIEDLDIIEDNDGNVDPEDIEDNESMNPDIDLPVIAGNELKTNEAYLDVRADGTVEVDFYMNESLIQEFFGVDINATVEEIEEIFVEIYKEDQTQVISVKKGIEGFLVHLLVEDFREIFDYELLIQQVANEEFSGNYDNMSEDYPMYYYNTEDKWDAEEYELNNQEVIMDASINGFACYFSFPYDIKSISDLEVTKLDEHLIYSEKGVEFLLILDNEFKGYVPTYDPEAIVDDLEDQGFLGVNEYLYIYQEDGSLIVEMNLDYDDFEFQFGIDSTHTNDKIYDEIEEYLELIEAEAMLIDVIKNKAGIDITLYYEDALSMLQLTRVSDYANEWYSGDYSALATSEPFKDFQTEESITDVELQGAAEQIMVPVSGTFNAAYVQLRGDITYVSEYMEYIIIAPNFIMITEPVTGFIVFDDSLNQ